MLVNTTTSEQEITITQIRKLIIKCREGDVESQKKLKNLLTTKSDEEDFNVVREIIIAGYEPAFKLIVMELNNDGLDEDLICDYSNEFTPHFGLALMRKKDGKLEMIRQYIRDRPMYHVEEQYFYNYFDPITKRIRKSTNKIHIKVNKIVDYINQNFEKITMEEFLKLFRKLYFLIYRKHYK